MSHCPQCGRSMQSKRWSRRYGWILLAMGILITVVMSAVLVAIGSAFFGTGGGPRFSGSAGEAKLVEHSRGGGVLWNHRDLLWPVADRYRAA